MNARIPKRRPEQAHSPARCDNCEVVLSHDTRAHMVVSSGELLCAACYAEAYPERTPRER